MEKWLGAAGVCVKDKKVLMVLQGTKEEPKCWSVPSGGMEKGETYEECCIREIKEETGYDVEIIKPLFQKESPYGEVHYFEAKVTGGSPIIQDPDNLIYDIDWKSESEIEELTLTYEEDRDFLIKIIGK
ncbi:aminoglycoside 6'-N-acetyltransferase [Bacillus pakistanensis]|uniref:Aminoglycoside 6'-N-acetyltransferase n=1 Tax=Rossellomorea pakistanensis TaxID=992288 RepID=A0ABS2NCS8_9BACI|nr:NUDIX hydrolase [Bacillus pakistanensis]MBM7585659.1 aminoglycoside 6'-N-acetyltransferase [Bacillus pakistanensis]